MAEAILVKSSRPVDSKITEGSSNLVTSGGIYSSVAKYVTEYVSENSPPEVHVGSDQPTGEEVIWFDTSVVLPANDQTYVLLADSELYVSEVGNDIIGDGTEVKPYATINTALESIPKNLNGNTATVKIDEGVYSEEVDISGFFGGKLVLEGVSENGGVANVTIGNVKVKNNSYIDIKNINLSTAGIYEFNSTIHVDNDVTITGDGASIGIELDSVSNFITAEGVNVTINQVATAVKVSELSKAYIDNLAGSNIVDGIVAESGSTVNASAVGMKASIMYTTSSGANISVEAQPTLANY